MVLGSFFEYIGKKSFLCNQKTLREDAHDVLRKAALQLHIGAQSKASPVGDEGFMEFERTCPLCYREECKKRFY